MVREDIDAKLSCILTKYTNKIEVCISFSLEELYVPFLKVWILFVLRYFYGLHFLMPLY